MTAESDYGINNQTLGDVLFEIFFIFILPICIFGGLKILGWW